MTEATSTTIRMVYIGLRLNPTGKMCLVFAPLTPQGLADNEKWYLKGKTPAKSIGGIYAIKIYPDGGAVIDRASYEGPYEAPEAPKLRMEWYAAEARAELDARKRTAEKKLGEENPIEEALQPLRELYIRSDRTTKRLIKVMILETLERF